MNYDGQPQICDFGISSVVASSTSLGITSSHSSGAKGSLRWMAIELLIMTEAEDSPVSHSKETDVWAFGMTAYVCIPFSPNFTPFSYFDICRSLLQSSCPMLISNLNLRHWWLLSKASYLPNLTSRPCLTMQVNLKYGTFVVRAGSGILRKGPICSR